jgi:SAM-dependent methyltransferase
MTADKVWHEDDAFWHTFAPGMFTPEIWEAVPQQVDQMLALLGIEPGARVLDLCCGPGRHSLELARRGCTVTGVDRTAEYLQDARRRAQEEGLSVEFVEADMRRFVRPAAFDAVVNMFTAFGYFRDPEDDARVLRNVRESLRPGGRLLIDVMGKEVLARIFLPRNWEERDGVLFLQDRRVTDDWSWIENRWIAIDAAGRHETQVSHRVYSAVELRRLLTECGFGQVRIFGDLDGSDYDQNGRRLVALARKPDERGTAQ